MAMASDHWEAVGDSMCLILVFPRKPEKQYSRDTANKFLIKFEAVIRRVTSDEADRIFDLDVIPRVITNTSTLELEDSDSSNMDARLSETLRELQVPLEERPSMVEQIMFRATEEARKARRPSPYAGGKRLDMLVNIDLHVIDDDDDDAVDDANGSDGGIVGDYREPRFVPASALSIKKLERTIVQAPATVCSVCMEEIRVGFEATKMPCSHLYHKDCIEEWLKRSGVCPLCKFHMPN